MPIPMDTFVQLREVDAYAHLPGGLRNHHHTGTPLCWLVDPSDDSHTLHAIQLLLDRLHEGDGHSTGGRQSKRRGVVLELYLIGLFQLPQTLEERWELLLGVFPSSTAASCLTKFNWFIAGRPRSAFERPEMT